MPILVSEETEREILNMYKIVSAGMTYAVL